MRLLRSWPENVPPGRNYIADDAERLVISQCNYRPLADIDDDVLLLEWDVACAKEQLRAFAARASLKPDRVLVAPYALYMGAIGLPEPLWAHRHWDGGDGMSVSVASATPLRTGDPACQLFGLGMVYLPRELVRGFLDEGWATHFGDVEFSTWHYRRVRHDVQVDWSVRPVHVNYQMHGLFGGSDG